jgi:hypothetical protein
MGCAHDVCKTGAALTSGCDKCATQVCTNDPYCCKTSWDFICVGKVWKQCNLDCNPNGPSCEKQYSSNPGLMLCWQGADCAFAYNATQKACADLCTAGGGECIAAYDDQFQNKCTIGQKVQCTSTFLQSGVCVCSRGCGGGAPCQMGQKCVGGKCS